jgi:hypothetical protein
MVTGMAIGLAITPAFTPAAAGTVLELSIPFTDLRLATDSRWPLSSPCSTRRARNWNGIRRTGHSSS